MQAIPPRCPLCGGEILVTRIHCHDCDTTFDGRFTPASPAFGRLNREQLTFMETFVRCEGKLNRMADEVGMSYPTLRGRLHELIRALGYEPGGEETPPGLTDEDRQRILEELNQGQITAERAMQLLKEKGG